MTDWCNDCAWPEACSMARECARRARGEVRGSALPEDGFTGELPGLPAHAGSCLEARDRARPVELRPQTIRGNRIGAQQ